MEDHNHSRTRAEILDKLTLDLIEQAERGDRPDVADAARRYPELADELEALLANYWLEDRATLAELREEQASINYHSHLQEKFASPAEKHRIAQIVAGFAKVMNAQAEVADPQVVGSSNPTITQPVIPGLYKLAATKGIKPPELARQVGLSSDLMMKLDRRAFRLPGLPRELLNRLGQVLDVSLGQLQAYLGGTQIAGVALHLNQDKPGEAQAQDFAHAVRQSEGLDTAQKAFWLAQADRDAMGEPPANAAGE